VTLAPYHPSMGDNITASACKQALNEMMDAFALYGDSTLGHYPPAHLNGDARFAYSERGREGVADLLGLHRTHVGAWAVMGRRFRTRALAMRFIMLGAS
jgi:hypothetical protein